MHGQRGNILFLILLAVILFAALSYAVTQSLRGGGRDASDEKLELVASQLLQNVHLIEQTMMRAQLVQGITDWGFNLYPAHDDNATCMVAACNIYTERNGGVPYHVISPEFTTTGVESEPAYLVYKSEGIGTTANDLIVTYANITKPLCDKLNQILKNGVDSDVTDSVSGTNNNYNGTLTAMPAATGGVGETNTAAAGKKGYCLRYNPTVYRFHYVLLER